MKTCKVFAIALCLLLAVCMTVMAGGGQDQGGVTTITVWSNDAHNKAEFDQLIAAFNNGEGARKNIKVEYSVYGADWNTAMNMAMETDRAPDMFKGFLNFENFQEQGKFLPWTEISGIKDLLDAHAPYARNKNTHFKGVPYSIAMYGWFSGFHYNKDLLQRAGFSAPPRTWAEFEQQAIAISRLAPNIYGYGIPLLWSPDFCHWVTEFAATNSIGHMYWNYAEGRYNFAAFTEYFEMLSRIREANGIFPGMESLSDDQLRAHFSAGNVGFIMGAGWNVGVLYEQFPFGGANASGAPRNPTGWDYAPLPVRDVNNVYAVPVSAGASYYVNAEVKNNRAKLRAMSDVIRLFCGDETQMLMFTAGKHVPLRPDIAAKAAPSERPQWTSYGRTVTRTVTMPSAPHNQLAVEGADRAAVIGQILTGQIPRANIRAALTDLDRRMNAAFDQAVQRGIIKREDFIDPTFEQRLRAR